MERFAAMFKIIAAAMFKILVAAGFKTYAAMFKILVAAVFKLAFDCRRTEPWGLRRHA